MELTCPSCSSKHRTEDYPGAFEIQCACGYSILVPDEASLFAPPPEQVEDLGPLPDFDGAPMAQEHYNDNAKVSLASDDENPLNVELMAAQAQDGGQAFSSLNLTAPEDLPAGMPYDPFELQNQWKPEAGPVTIVPEVTQVKAPKAAPAAPAPVATPATPKVVEAQDIVNRIQMASIGYMHGALFDLDLGELPEAQLRKLSAHCTQVLDARPWLRAFVDKAFEKPETLLRNKQLLAVPELLAVEIYLHCAQNEIRCDLRAHRS
jgi:hypothetical protein